MSRLVTFARVDGPVSTDELNRIGGEPIGITEETWPRYKRKPMIHVITVARANIVVPMPEEVVAVAVFVSSLAENEAFEPTTKETAVLFLTGEDIALGTTSAQAVLGEKLEGAEPGRLVTAERRYVFEEIAKFDEDEKPRPASELSEEEIGWAVAEFMAKARCAEIAGTKGSGLSTEHVDWCQSPESPKGHRVLFYLHDSLVPGLNCGDGFLYVTANAKATMGAAWWQC